MISDSDFILGCIFPVNKLLDLIPYYFSQNLEDLLRDKEKDRKDLAGKVESLQRDLQTHKQDKQQLKKGAALLHEKLKEKTKQVGYKSVHNII